MKPVLLISYYFPPNPAVGAVRPSKFADYLPEFGWRPIVLTASSRPGDGGTVARESAQDHRSPLVHPVAEWPHLLKTYERSRARAAAKRGTLEAHAAKVVLTFEQCHAPRGGLKRWLLVFFSLPDRETGWLIPAVLRGLRAIRRSKVNHLVTTGPPFTCHLVGLILKRVTGVRWIADFRDPWSLRHKFPVFRTRATDAIESWLIRSVLRNADRVISVTPAMTDELMKEHVAIPSDRFHTLMSGFDPADFSRLVWSRPYPNPVIFSYFGTFYHGRTPEPFLGALKSLLDDGSLKPQDIQVRFVGQVAQADGKSVSEMVRHLGLEGLVTLHSSVPRQEALKQTLESHVVLVLDERHPIQIPLKLYDAMAAGVTIFNVGSGGASADVLMRTGRGVSVSYERPAEVRAGILECVKRAREAVTKVSARPWEDADIQDFDFRRLTGRLARHLDALS
jgi:glycosyltransferase involved in cell wall biosynthesis